MGTSQIPLLNRFQAMTVEMIFEGTNGTQQHCDDAHEGGRVET